MLCHDFLIRSIGPTICRLAETPDGTGKVLREGGQADTNEVERVWSLVEACWTDIYGRSRLLCGVLDRADSDSREGKHAGVCSAGTTFCS